MEKSLEKPLIPMVDTWKTIDIPSCPKIYHRYGLISTNHRQISIGNLPCICMKVREGSKDHIVMVSLIVRVDPLVLTVALLFQGPGLCSSSASSIRHSKRQTRSWGRAGSCTRVPGPREKENFPHGHLTLLSQNQHLHQHHLVRPLAMLQGREGAGRSKILPSYSQRYPGFTWRCPGLQLLIMQSLFYPAS